MDIGQEINNSPQSDDVQEDFKDESVTNETKSTTPDTGKTCEHYTRLCRLKVKYI